MKAGYEEYEDVKAALSSEQGTVLSGALRVIPMNRKIAFVTAPNIEVDILIPSELHRNRAIHGDIVLIRLLPTSEWVPLPPKGTNAANGNNLPQQDLQRQRKEDKDQIELMRQRLWKPNASKSSVASFSPSPSPSSQGEQHFIDKVSSSKALQPVAKVIAILEASHQTSIIGSLSFKCKIEPKQRLPESVSFILFHPQDPKYPFIKILRNQLPPALIEHPFEMRNHIFLVDLLPSHWPIQSESPLGENPRSIGEMGEINAETEALLIQHQCNHGLFSEECVKPLQDILGPKTDVWTIPAEEISKRRDLRHMRIFTIDPPTAKDLDGIIYYSTPTVSISVK